MLIALLFLLAPTFVYAEEARTDLPTAPFYELGLTVGTPALVNLDVGYWSDSSFPWVARVSGGLFGFQTDFGWAFDREGVFKQYVSFSFMYWNMPMSDGGSDLLIGGGPIYSFNVYGFMLQAGLIVAADRHDFRGFNAAISPAFQIGYSHLW